MKECINGGSVGEPSMLKLNNCYLNSNISEKRVEMRKIECTLIREVLSFI